MKKLFFFKSSTSSNGTNKDKQLQTHNSIGDGLLRTSKSGSKKAAAYEDHNQDQTGPFLRRSRSYSSAAFLDSRLLRTQNDSPSSSSSNIPQKQSASRSSRRALTPERPSRSKWFQDAAIDAAHKTEKLAFTGVDNLSSESSSYCSSKVLDRYIDGEQHQEWTSRHINSNTKTHVSQPNGGVQKPPRVQYAAPASHSPTGSGVNHRPKSHSFRDPNRESKLYMSTRDWVENSVAHESPRQLAKQVVERLSQSRVLPRVDSNSKEFDLDIPITLSDIYGGSQNCLPRDGPEEINYRFDDDCSRVLDYEESEDADEMTLLKAELESRTRKLEKERNEMQLSLEKELDRRSTEWSTKLEKCKTEEHRLRERVRELAEQNVSLQREVSLLGEKEIDNQSRIKLSGQQVKDMTVKMDELVKENQKLQQDVSELKDRYVATEEDRNLFKRNFESKDKECNELRKSVTRLVRTTNEQEKTIQALREGFSDQNQPSKMQTELFRLSGVEQDLRKEVESYRLEAESLRRENINLLNRLKGNPNDNGFSTLKLDQQVWDSIHCLQSQGTGLINDSVHLCEKLIENIKERALQNGLDSQFIMESDMKLQGFKRGAKSLTRGLQVVSNVQREKSSTGTLDNECSEDVVKSDLKAEALMTSLLREKLYSKEVDVERLEAELATAVRGNDVLRCEVQNAMDNLSCVTHKMKDLEMQVFKKDENIYHLQNSLQECRKELSIVNGILPKVSEERDMMWDEVKQYSENNMLLTSEIGMLKKKVEALDEDVLLKEGQITILKDALGKPFDLLSSPVSSKGFLV
ncbi:hypothetical protein HanPI659440_Chr00c15g0727901 [Helianthus annuus]|nr:hypothetical protein HanPI659440_Chr00c15g0727901 [Helianthus annuus]